MADAPTRVKAVSVNENGGACPAQFDIITTDGALYTRYRHGHFAVYRCTNDRGDINWSAPILEEDDDTGDGWQSVEEMIALTQSIIDWSSAVITDWQGHPLRAAINYTTGRG